MAGINDALHIDGLMLQNLRRLHGRYRLPLLLW
jgi:hypothetical protein